MRALLLLTSIIVLTFSCKKDNVQGLQEEYLACSNNALTDTTLIAGRLAGNWQLAGQSCHFGTNTQSENVRVTFYSDRTFIVKKDNSRLAQGNWHFTGWGTGWSLQMSAMTQYFGGAILMCDKMLVFSAMPVDGCNNYFRKTL